MSEILTLSGLQHTQIDLAPTAIEKRDKLALEASGITQITDEMDADAAASVLRDIKTQIDACELARTTIGKPVLEVTRKINDTAKSYVAILQTEKDRLSRVLGAWQQAQRDKAEKARREAEEEARRVRAEEAKKIAAAEIEHGSDAPETIAAQEKAADRVAESRVAIAAVAPVQPKGSAVLKRWKFEVIDINALFAAKPDLVVLSPNTAAINAVIKNNQNIPGLRIWEEVTASIR